ncbi:cyclic nucleotide-binding domain-containing protein [Chitinophaga sp. SYP-B3965]|uniref:Crp/Fnr family transcriptional regulator n=1 Tax=Chitinophaga sp. SYP-B3965 TaxID=2663120 RepID=UPI001299E5F4|nr:Crp/Fnr family transcriptional regulator [Chitinophaga sp. SYP-B3965]MRG43545.1 cyclic nucleotide-binding domain-containing protein [Chitinophaga sp. SYP-B3965]
MANIAETGLYNYLVESKTPGLKENVKLITLKKGAQLYGTSEPFTDIFEIVSGAVKLGGISVKGKDYIYELVTPGEFFGNLALLSNDTFCEFCKTLTATQFRSYKVDFFKHLMTHDPKVAEWCFAKIVYRWNKTESMLANIRSYEPRERILLLYADLHKKITTAGNREVFLNKLITYNDIADLTATTRQLAADTIK